jgi:hypothetical protein
MSVGHEWVAIETILVPSEEPPCNAGRKDVKDEKNEL